MVGISKFLDSEKENNSAQDSSIAKRKPPKRPAKQSKRSSGSSKQQPKDDQSSRKVSQEKSGFPIIAIGASAGGLEAYERFFRNVPSSSGMVFVLVQHLDAKHNSILAELIAQYTIMKVAQVEDGTKVEPNCVYVIPPDRDLAILNDTLHLIEPTQPRHQRLTIDNFLRSLAEDAKERAVCIILSGTGTDGTQGLKAIKEAGGMVMVQEPTSAKFDGMPANAIQTGLVDYTIAPENMPDKLIAYLQHRDIALQNKMMLPIGDDIRVQLQKVLVILRSKVGHDFSQYKENTILRRVQRRMAINQIDSIADYIMRLQKNREESSTLFKELLIGVSNFYRDPEVFELLETKIIPGLFADRNPDQPIRIWVPGCATGEEAYSIAILLHEHMETQNHQFNIQIFSTDLDSHAIEFARLGIYPDTISAYISSDRLKRYFTKEGNSYEINKKIRDMLVIAEQNLIKDPPFSSLDLISCRNLLIYFGASLQAKVLPIFHYALKPNGHLLLGTSETVGSSSHLFKTINRKWKLYQRKPICVDDKKRFEPPIIQYTREPPIMFSGESENTEPDFDLKSAMENLLLAQHTPACVIINDHYEILFIHGRTGKYLEANQGKASFNILKQAREGLLPDLTTAIRKVKTEGKSVKYEGVRVGVNGGVQHINLLVKPLSDLPELSSYKVVIFEDIEQIHIERKTKPMVTSGDKDKRIAELEKELSSTKEYLQTTIEELESSNEELKSTNEEMQASNEELQSANEELETSKEEGQSINEELTTVNSEYQEKINELSKANDDMANYMASTDVGVVFLDLDLNVRRFTPRISEFINLIPSDIGRPLSHIVTNLLYESISNDASKVLEDLVPIEVEVQTKSWQWLNMRVKPYRTLENVIDGVVITFMDITSIKKQKRLNRLAVVVQDSYDAITVQDLSGVISAWNPGAERMYGYIENEAIGKSIKMIVPKVKIKEIDSIIKKVASGEQVLPFETQRHTKDGKILDVLVTITNLCDETGKLYAMATTERNLSHPP
ncbi:MAG: PAS domain-containing protein [Magnetococcales bacterium]|nr:PAS domain-containing protein [Magnetococcales bacterium]